MIVKEVSGLAEISRLNGDDGNVELVKLLPENRRHGLHGVFRRAIRREAGITKKTGDAAHVDDATLKTNDTSLFDS